MDLKYGALVLVSALALGGGSGALAQQGPSDPEIDCGYALTQQDMNICAGRDFKAADAELNTVYQQALATMRAIDTRMAGTDWPGSENTLRAAQRAWVPYRDNPTPSEGLLAHGGSMEPLLVASCMTVLTKRRTEDLKDLISGLGQ